MGAENLAPHWDLIPAPSIPYRVTTPEDVRYTMIHIRHEILISGKLRYLATPFPGDVRQNNFYYNSYRKIQQDATMYKNFYYSIFI
jgi:hypothetical protein